MRLQHKVTVEYTGAKPDKTQNHLIVSNHRSNFDPPLVSSFMNMRTGFLAKKELFANPLFSFLITMLSAIVLDRGNTQKSTFDKARKMLRTKCFGLAWNIGVFIEGTRSKDPVKLGKPNNGPIFLARIAKVPILPVGITYKENGDIAIKVGEAYELDRKQDQEDAAWDCLEKISLLTDYEMPQRD